MFGLNDNNQSNNQAGAAPQPAPSTTPYTDLSQLSAVPAGPDPVIAPTTASAPALPELPDEPLNAPPPAIIPERPSAPPPEPPASAHDAPAPPDTSPSAPPPDELLDLKEKALTNLAPLVDHLDQSPEEKFRTTMMLIQASDNSALVKEAYEAANAIPDEKARAQALLDVVNEINYFTQHHDSPEN